MYTLGISYGYHDSSAAIVRDGVLVAASTEDRFSRQKHDYHFPNNAVEYCLRQAGISIGDVSQVVFHEDPHEKFTRILCSAFSGFPFTKSEFVNSTKAWLSEKLWAFKKISSSLAVDPKKIYYLNHHYSHVMTGFLGSGFDTAAVLVLDAVGDWSSTSLYTARWDGAGPQLEKVREIGFPNSLCLAYSAFTEFLGFKPNDSECSTMALAAFGKPVYEKEVREIIRQTPDGYEIDQEYFNFVSFYKGATTERFHEVFGEKRDPRSPISFSSFESVSDQANQRYADIAASIQKVFTDTVLHLVGVLHAKNHSPNLCIVGGGAMNCVAMAEVGRRSGFQNFYIPPDPGDGGSAIGAALYLNALHGPKKALPRDLVYQPFLGESFAAKQELDFVDLLEPAKFARFEKLRSGSSVRKKWVTTRYDLAGEKVLDEAARLLMERKIVGFFSERFEIGPRALGGRSILIRPDDVELAKRLSNTVKKRDYFRPYALSILRECAEEALELPDNIQMLRWMQSTARIKDSHFDRIKASAHIDRTTRPQICFPEEQTRLGRLLERMKQHTGLGALVNTSFNESGFPMVASPIDAAIVFARSSLDALVFDDLVIEKVPI